MTKKLKAKAFEEGFDAVGIAKVPGSSRIKHRTAALERWLQAGHQAKMEWMRSPRRKNMTPDKQNQHNSTRRIMSIQFDSQTEDEITKQVEIKFNLLFQRDRNC